MCFVRDRGTGTRSHTNENRPWKLLVHSQGSGAPVQNTTMKKWAEMLLIAGASPRIWRFFLVQFL